MSLYKVGCLTPVAGTALEKQDYVVGALVATPGFIRDQIMGLAHEVAATDAEIWSRVQPLGASELMDWYMNAWAPFTAEWKKFTEAHDSWYENLWGSTLDTVNQYRLKLRDLRAAFRKAGGTLTTPEPRPPEQGWVEGLTNSITGMGKFVKNVVYVLLILAGGYLAYKAFVIHKGGVPA